MPTTTRRACKDLSITETQKRIEFPCRKTRSSVAAIKNQKIKSLNDEKPKTNPRKRSAMIVDENSSPCKSPRKCPPCKSPLVDRSNIQCDPSIGTPEFVKRKLQLQSDNVSSLKRTGLRQALHTSIPNCLIAREKEQELIGAFIEKTMINLQPGSLYLSGAPGTGKTACLTKALELLKESKCKKYQAVFINCMSIKCSQSIFSKVSSEFHKGTKPLAVKEAQRFLEKTFTSTGPRILLVLDEIDQLESKNQDVLYKLFEMPFLPKSRLVLIGIANALDLTDRILPRLQSKAMCKPLLLQFSPYTKDQITEILNSRLKEIGSSDIDPVAVQFCARKVHAITGDVRKALDILRRSVELKEAADKRNKKDDHNSNASISKKVTISHVASVCSEVYGSRLSSTSSGNSFPLQQKLIICSLMVCLRDKKIKEVTTGKLYEVYSRICKSRQMGGVTHEEMSSACNLLESQGMISMKKTKDPRNHKITLRLQEKEVEHALQDKTLMTSILSSHSTSSSS